MWKQRKKLRKKILRHNFALDLYKYLSNAPNNNSKNDETEQNEIGLLIKKYCEQCKEKDKEKEILDSKFGLDFYLVFLKLPIII